MALILDEKEVKVPVEKIQNENEKIKLLDQKIQKLQNQRQTLLQKQKNDERKARTRRLIEMGALAEKYLEIHTPEELETYLKNKMSVLKTSNAD